MAGMRGSDHQPTAMFSYVSAEERVPRDHPLRAIRTFVDEILREMTREFDALYAQHGRPSIPPERLLRAQLLQLFKRAPLCLFLVCIREGKRGFVRTSHLVPELGGARGLARELERVRLFDVGGNRLIDSHPPPPQR